MNLRLATTLTAAAIALVAALRAAPASAAPQSTPNGPWVTDEQHVSLSALRGYEQLWSTLEQIARSATGRGAS